MDPKAPIDVGRRLAVVRLRRGLSQATVARRAGIAPSYVSRIETGKVQPTFRTVQRVAGALRVPFAEIAGPESSCERGPGPCPVSASGSCMLDLIYSESDVARGRADEAFTPRQVKLLRRFAAWLRAVAPDRLRAMEVLVEDLTRADASVKKKTGPGLW